MARSNSNFLNSWTPFPPDPFSTKLRSVDKARALAFMKKYGMKWEEQAVIQLRSKSDSSEGTDAAAQEPENEIKMVNPDCG